MIFNQVNFWTIIIWHTGNYWRIFLKPLEPEIFQIKPKTGFIEKFIKIFKIIIECFSIMAVSRSRDSRCRGDS